MATSMTLARFVIAHGVVTVIEENRDDPNHEPEAAGETGRTVASDDPLKALPLGVVTLPMPGAPLYFNDASACRSAMRISTSAMRRCWCRRSTMRMIAFAPRHAGGAVSRKRCATVVGIHAVDLVWGLGTLHCMTQQQPRSAMCEAATRKQRSIRERTSARRRAASRLTRYCTHHAPRDGPSRGA